jgi:GAF domain-containing protein
MEPGARFPGEDGGRTLAEIAHRDLDAALQLLAERAQYITGASGAAIALRRGEHNDMLCRASAGSNAPELGALLSMEYGLSGESVRTRQTLRCDDAESDPRVNREGCRRLGIASVVVMPVASDEQVLGVFELFSGQPRAFEERDISALRRLSEMVETAVRHAVAAQSALPAEEPANLELPPTVDAVVAGAAEVETDASVIGVDSASSLMSQRVPNESAVHELSANELSVSERPAAEPATKEVERREVETMKSEPAARKPLFWSAAIHAPASGGEPAESVKVPPVLRSLQKCQACGFPVSQGRTLCVECEEKQWRGKPLSKTAPDDKPRAEKEGEARREPPGAQTRELLSTGLTVTAPADVRQEPKLASSDNSAPFLSSALPAESWLVANKYILAALLIVALVIAAIVLLR